MNTKIFFLYLAYALFAFILLFYLLFPKETAGRLMADRLNRITPELSVRLNPVKLVPPLGLKALKPEITLFKRTTVNLDYLLLSQDLLTLLGSNRKLNFKAEAFKGVLDGELVSPQANSMTLNSKFSGIEIGPLEYTNKEIFIRSRFILDGTFEYKNQQALCLAKGTLLLSKLITELDNPMLENLGISQLHFSTVNIDYTINKNLLEIISFKAVGDEVTITMAGTGSLEFPVEKSVLNLRGDIRPEPSYVAGFAEISSIAILFDDSKKGGIPFTISGTLEKPRFKL